MKKWREAVPTLKEEMIYGKAGYFRRNYETSECIQVNKVVEISLFTYYIS